MSQALSLGEVAHEVNCDYWQVYRIVCRLPGVSKFGRYYAVTAKDLPRIKRALREAGYLRDERPAAAR
jgi:hypothetical protein